MSIGSYRNINHDDGDEGSVDNNGGIVQQWRMFDYFPYVVEINVGNADYRKLE